MSFVERVNQGESLASWLNWLTEPPAVSRSVIMGHLTAIWKGEIWALPNAFRTGPGSCAVHSMTSHESFHGTLLTTRYLLIDSWAANINVLLGLTAPYVNLVWLYVFQSLNSHFRWDEKFNSTPWNSIVPNPTFDNTSNSKASHEPAHVIKTGNFKVPLKSMIFHWITDVIEIGKPKVWCNFMESYAMSSFPFSMTLMVPWNS